MDNLYSLGIDLKLLLAQIVNFSLLVYLLHRFLYRPIIERIEKEEKELEEVGREKEKLTSERSNFSEEMKKEREKIKGEGRKIIEEAQSIAEKISREKEEEIEKEKKSLLERAESLSREELRQKETETEKRIKEKYKDKLIEVLKEYFGQGKTAATDGKLFEELIADIKSVGNDNLDSSLSKATVESVESLSDEKKSVLKKSLSEKLGRDGIEVENKINSDLIAGYRLTFGGLIIDRNLSHETNSIFESS